VWVTLGSPARRQTRATGEPRRKPKREQRGDGDIAAQLGRVSEAWRPERNAGHKRSRRVPPVEIHPRVKRERRRFAAPSRGTSNVVAARRKVARRDPVLHASSRRGLHQRSWRVNVGGDIGDSNRWREHRTVQIALCVQGRCDAGTALGLAPTLSVCPLGIRASGGRHASGGRGQRALRGIRWLPKHGEGRSRPGPYPAAPSSWGGARASCRGGGAVGAWRMPHRTCGSSRFASAPRVRAFGTTPRPAAAAGNSPIRRGEGCKPGAEAMKDCDLARHERQCSPGPAAVATPACFGAVFDPAERDLPTPGDHTPEAAHSHSQPRPSRGGRRP
jgi:hypothetical protein